MLSCLIWIDRGHISEKKDVSAKWVLLFGEAIVVCILGNLALLSTSIDFIFGWHKRLHIPANLLGGSHLPFASLTRNSLAPFNSPLHRLLLEDTINSCRVKAKLIRSIRPSKRFDVARALWRYVVRLLSYEFD